MSNLLIQEPPLQVLPSLAVNIGLNEAIVLQQIHYWQSMRKNLRDGRYWVYNSVTQWEEQFPFWSYSTIRRALASLKELGVVDTANYNKDRRDKTLWYTINYNHPKMSNMAEGNGVGQMQDANMTFARCQNGITQDANMSQPLPENTTEITNKDLKKRRDAHEEETPEQLENLFSPQAPEPQSRFRIPLNWRPDRNKLEPYCMNAGCPTTARPDQLIDGIIGEWVNIWHSDGGANSEAKWLSLLAGFIKRKLADHDSGGWNKQTKPRSYGVPQRNQDFESIDHREGGAELGLEVI